MSRSGYRGDIRGRTRNPRTRRLLATTSPAARGASTSPTPTGGSVVGNKVHDNCAGMFFEAFKARTRGWLRGNGQHGREQHALVSRPRNSRGSFSGIGIALLGASGMELTANDLSGNVPSGPTPFSGGVVVCEGPVLRRIRSESPRTTPSPATTLAVTSRTSSRTSLARATNSRGNICDTSAADPSVQLREVPRSPGRPRSPAGLSLESCSVSGDLVRLSSKRVSK